MCGHCGSAHCTSAAVHLALTELSGLHSASQQHTDVGLSQVCRDCSDLQKFLDWLQASDPFSVQTRKMFWVWWRWEEASSSGSRRSTESEHSSEDTWDSEQEYREEQKAHCRVILASGLYSMEKLKRLGTVCRHCYASMAITSYQKTLGHSRTLKRPPRTIPVADICGGKSICFGLKRAVEMQPLTRPSPECRLKVEVQVNVDGVTSRLNQFWLHCIWVQGNQITG